MELLSGQWFYWAASKYECVSLCEKVSTDVNETELKGFLFDVSLLTLSQKLGEEARWTI